MQSRGRVHGLSEVHRHWTDNADKPTEKLIISAGTDQKHAVRRYVRNMPSRVTDQTHLEGYTSVSNFASSTIRRYAYVTVS
jgi:hypothetical protein